MIVINLNLEVLEVHVSLYILFSIYASNCGRCRHMWQSKIPTELANRTKFLHPTMMSTLLCEVMMASLQDDLHYGTRSNVRTV